MSLQSWLERFQTVGDNGDLSLDGEAAAAFKSDLERHLKERDALQTDYDALNHMLTHQPPSAWAKREKKYHDDKKAWDEMHADFLKQKARLTKEIAELKADNRMVTLLEAKAALEAECKALQAQVAEQASELKATHMELGNVKSSLASLQAAHAETVQENVRMNMAHVKIDADMRGKNAEAAAEKNRADELSRLLEDVKSKYNETSLKVAGLHEQIESGKARLAAEKEAHAAEKAQLQQTLAVLQDASSTADDKAGVLRAQMESAQATAAALDAANADLRRALESTEARLAEAHAAAAERAAAAESAALAAARLEIKALKDAQSHWEGESVALKNEGRALRAQLAGLQPSASSTARRALGRTDSATALPPDAFSTPRPATTPREGALQVRTTTTPATELPRAVSADLGSNISVGSAVQTLNLRGGVVLSPQDASLLRHAGLAPALDQFYAALAESTPTTDGRGPEAADGATVAVGAAVGVLNLKGGDALTPGEVSAVRNVASIHDAPDGHRPGSPAAAPEAGNGLRVDAAVGALNAAGGKPLTPANGARGDSGYTNKLAKGLAPSGRPLTSEQASLLRVAACTGLPDDGDELSSWSRSDQELFTGVASLLQRFQRDSDTLQWARIGSNAAALDGGTHYDGTPLTGAEVSVLEALALQSCQAFPDLVAQWQEAIATGTVPSVLAKAIVSGKLRVAGDVADCISEGTALPPAQVLLLRTAAAAIVSGGQEAPAGPQELPRIASTLSLSTARPRAPPSVTASPLPGELSAADLACGQRRGGEPLASGEVQHLREVAMEVAADVPSLAAHWASLSDDAFMAAFAAVLSTHCAMYHDADAPGETQLASFSDAQLRTLGKAAYSVSVGPGDQLVPRAPSTLARVLTFADSDTPRRSAVADAEGGLPERARPAEGSASDLSSSPRVAQAKPPNAEARVESARTPAEQGNAAASTSSQSVVADADADKPAGVLGFGDMPNSPNSRALRQYAAEKELEAELHQEMVKKLMKSLQEKDDEMAELEGRVRDLLGSSAAAPEAVPADPTVLDWNPFSVSKKAQDRIKQLETQVRALEDRVRYYQHSTPSTSQSGVDVDFSRPRDVLVPAQLDDPEKALEAEKAYWMGENMFLMNQLVQVKVEMAERSQDYTANKRALARSLDRERSLRDEIEELQIRMSRLQNENEILSIQLQAHAEAAAASSPGIFSVFGASKPTEPEYASAGYHPMAFVDTDSGHAPNPGAGAYGEGPGVSARSLSTNQQASSADTDFADFRTAMGSADVSANANPPGAALAGSAVL